MAFSGKFLRKEYKMALSFKDRMAALFRKALHPSNDNQSEEVFSSFDALGDQPGNDADFAEFANPNKFHDSTLD